MTLDLLHLSEDEAAGIATVLRSRSLGDMMEAAEAMTVAAHGRRVTYSRKVFIDRKSVV